MNSEKYKISPGFTFKHTSKYTRVKLLLRNKTFLHLNRYIFTFSGTNVTSLHQNSSFLSTDNETFKTNKLTYEIF